MPSLGSTEFENVLVYTSVNNAKLKMHCLVTTNSSADYTCVLKTIQRLDDKIYINHLKSLKNTRSNIGCVGE
jgi:hypothetical protein